MRPFANLFCMGLVMLSLAPASGPGPSEQEVKAAFLFHFAQFTEWPSSGASAGKPFVACVAGNDAITPVLRAILAGKSLAGRPVSFRAETAGRDAAGCDLIFVSPSERKRFSLILQSVSSRPVLTIGDWPRFAAEGGMIGFYTEQGRVRFEVNVQAARAAGLTISSQVLRLARIVGQGKA